MRIRVSMPSSLRRWILPVLVLFVVVGRDAVACTMPVFRYAMDMWPADPYQVYVFYAGGAPGVDVETLLQAFSASDRRANAVVRGIDTTAVFTPSQRQLWRHAGRPPLPWMHVVTPLGAVLYQGAPDPEAVAMLHSSPRRRELGDRLTQGEAAVWILLESGDVDADTRATMLLRDELQRFTASGHPDSASASALWPGARFSLLRVSRDDPRERAFVDMLLLTEPDLRELEGPIAFPVFGRGRVLYALAGGGISVANIIEACAFVAGECSCQAKELNPGVDLLLAVDWAQRLEDAAEARMPLSGGLVEDSVPPGAGDAAPRSPADGGILSFLLATRAGRRLAMGLVAGLAVIALVTWGMMRR